MPVSLRDDGDAKRGALVSHPGADGIFEAMDLYFFYLRPRGAQALTKSSQLRQLWPEWNHMGLDTLFISWENAGEKNLFCGKRCGW